MVARGCGSRQALVCLTPPLAQLQCKYLHCPSTGQNECWDTEPLVLLLGPISGVLHLATSFEGELGSCSS